MATWMPGCAGLFYIPYVWHQKERFVQRRTSVNLVIGFLTLRTPCTPLNTFGLPVRLILIPPRSSEVRTNNTLVWGEMRKDQMSFQQTPKSTQTIAVNLRNLLR